MRQATDQERSVWLEKVAFVAPAVEILTAATMDLELSKRLECCLLDAPKREADLWAFFHDFLRAQDWVAVWDDFCLWLAQQKLAAELGERFGYLDLEDEIEGLVERYTSEGGD